MLDPAAEIDVFNRIIGLAGHGRTVILITHRLASVARAHRIYVLRHGQLAESGSHAELMHANAGYAAMYRIQAAQYEQEECSQLGAAFVADGQAAVARQPGDRALDLPPVPPGPLAGFDARRAMRGVMPRPRSHRRRSAES